MIKLTDITDTELIDLFDKQLPELLKRQPEAEYRIYRSFMKTFATKEEVAAVLSELRSFQSEVDERFDEVDERFDKVDKRFDEVEQRLKKVEQRLDVVEQRLEKVEQRLDVVEQRLEKVEQRLDRIEQQVEEFRAEVKERFEQVDRRMEAGFQELHRAIDRLGSRWGIRSESVFRQTMAELLEKSFGASVEERTIQGEQFDCVIHDGQHILIEIAASVGRKIQERLERKRRLYTEATGIEPERVILATASIHSRRAQLLREAGFEVIEPEED